MTLTPKQEAFAQNIASGMTQADAYRAAYDAGKMSDNAIYVAARRLLDNTKVGLRVDDIKQTLARRNLWTREMSVKALAKAYQIAEQGGNSSGMTGAVKELNAMHGYNVPLKLDLQSSDGSMTPKAIEIVPVKCK